MREALALLMQVVILICLIVPVPIMGQEASDSIEALKKAAEQGDAGAQIHYGGCHV